MEKSRVEWILRYGLGEVSTLPPRLSRIEKLLVELIRKGSGSDITVDDELSPTSENPVQNKVLNSIINGTGSGSVYSKIMLAIAEVVAEAPEDFDTLKEISDWISHHEDSAAAMNSAIQANTTAIAGKVDKVSGKGLSTNDYTTEEKNKLAEIESGAERNVQSDWNQTTITEDDFIKNKPILVGKNVEGETYNVDDTSYTAGEGAEIFNSYAYNKAIGEHSHSEGDGTIALGAGAHSEGGLTKAKGDHSHTEGYGTIADGDYNHAEGYYTTTYSMCSHAEGYETTASGTCSHSQGVHAVASGRNSHAEGAGTIAAGDMSHAQGKWNKSDTAGKYAFIIGNGTDGTHRSDAFAVDWNGLIYQNNSETGVDLNNKVDKVSGKGLSTNDYTTAEKTKLSGVEEGATKTIVDAELSSTSTNPVQNKAVKAAVGVRLVASDVLTSNTTYTYQMNKNDFDKSELGTYIISIVTWSTTPKYSLYAVSYTGNTIFRNLVTKIAGDDMTVTVEDAVISVSGFTSNGGKISIHALQ